LIKYEINNFHKKFKVVTNVNENSIINENQDNSSCLICFENFKEEDENQQLDKCKVYFFII